MHKPFARLEYGSHEVADFIPLANRNSWRTRHSDWLPPEKRAELIEEMRCEILALHEHMLIQPFEVTVETAHWLVSSAIILGYPRLAIALRAVERAALEERPEYIGASLLETLMDEFDGPLQSRNDFSECRLV